MLYFDYVIDDDFQVPASHPLVQASGKFISHSHRFIFILVPKVASQTLLKQLQGLHQHTPGSYDLSQQSTTELFLGQPQLRDYFRFAFVRDPFSRAVSCYVDKILNANERTRKMCRNAGMTRVPQSFQEFVEFLCSPEGGDAFANTHWASQSAFVCDRGGRSYVQAIGKLETLDEDRREIFERLGLDEPKAHWKNSRRDKPVTRNQRIDDASFWTPELQRRIRERYELDYRLFGYTPVGP